ncbi:hypothetical protein BD289DRAFT_204726 [Coniella lustricola]|uniref:Transmembrane protein n=1 Tax=Coniella lustricola TaxID=2025994 RepID=A0A2T2ZSE5_9PEZI|nr:hypothetical protein BD289DRAFT_204726 [Coniella lustricola]
MKKVWFRTSKKNGVFQVVTQHLNPTAPLLLSSLFLPIAADHGRPLLCRLSATRRKVDTLAVPREGRNIKTTINHQTVLLVLSLFLSFLLSFFSSCPRRTHHCLYIYLTILLTLPAIDPEPPSVVEPPPARVPVQGHVEPANQKAKTADSGFRICEHVARSTIVFRPCFPRSFCMIFLASQTSFVNSIIHSPVAPCL